MGTAQRDGFDRCGSFKTAFPVIQFLPNEMFIPLQIFFIRVNQMQAEGLTF